ncbi:tectonin domain-containing protein [Thermomonospora umbrina]|uniref:Cell wall-associated NlpC family hydrolase n=1 Tax=Thermomonospora umbrina TaxID=111806 RepID=A0A3D9SLJ4_9ACTN|nr:tectonin domain-containing protein [Thermomonospora umbrina]REE96728.1 hypothetical protein DFJ69_2175 [Thermomonospora umbrina]
MRRITRARRRIGFIAATSLLLTPIAAVSATASADPTPPKGRFGGQGPIVDTKGNRLSATALPEAMPVMTRDHILSRAQSWVGKGIVYNQDASYAGYRTDCSGFVSMAWNLGVSLTTPRFVPEGYAHWISKGELQAGDILLDDDAGDFGHVVVFDHWNSANQSSYVGYELSSSHNVAHRSFPYPYDAGSGPYAPARYNNVVPARGGTHLFAQSPDRSGVFQYAGYGNTWTKVGGAARDIYTGGAGLFATNPTTGDLYRYNGTPDSWSKVGGPGHTFVVAGDQLFGLSPDRGAVYQWTGGTSWIKVGGAAGSLIGGDGGLFATDPSSGDLYKYNGSPENWSKVGGPGAQFAVGGGRLYGLSPDKNAVYQWNGSGTAWTKVGGAAGALYAGWAGMFATNPSTGDLHKYNGTPESWSKVGGAGRQFAVSNGTVFGLSPNGGAVYKWTGSGTNWVQVGGPAASISVGN